MLRFTGSPLDRLAEKREDATWLAQRRLAPETVVIALDGGRPLVHNGSLARIPIQDPDVFLGVHQDRAYFAVETASDHAAGSFEELRAVALSLPEEEAAIAACARSLFDWHRRHRFCSNCGQATAVASAGWKRVCGACSAEHFPRVDPVVIMLPLHGGQCLVARQPSWPARRMSPLAGFVEPGESIDEACAREVWEEARLRAVSVRYHASQPWPFPSSLMIGLFVEVADRDAVADGVELEEVRWLTRHEAQAMVEGRNPDVLPPSAYSIAFDLLRTWSSSGSDPDHPLKF